MSALAQEPLAMSENQYLKFERASEFKHEYIDGEVYAMAGASWEHNLIAMNLGSSLNSQFTEKDCQVVSADMRLKVQKTGLYTYPDLLVICGEPIFSDDNLDTVINPILLIEILSPSTESFDRGKKFQAYREIESLKEYLLVSQDNPRIERFLRQNDIWIFSDTKGLEASLELPSIASKLDLRDIYRKVNFPKPKGEEKQN